MGRVRNEFTAIIEPAEEGGYWARCPEVPGANGQGGTLDEVLDDLRAGIELMLDYLRDKARDEMSAQARQATVAVG
jgi:predicted RNase H-like HicB family nuclease